MTENIINDDAKRIIHRLENELGERELEEQLSDALRYGGFTRYLQWLNEQLDWIHKLAEEIEKESR